MLQWEWLGGLPPLRRAAVVGSGQRATGLAEALRRAKIEVSTDRSEHSAHDLVVFAVPADELPAAVEAHPIPPRTGVLVASDGVLPTAYVSEHISAWAMGAVDSDNELERGASVALATDNEAFSRQVGDALSAAGLKVTKTPLADFQPGRFVSQAEKAGAGQAA
jgi:glycerol-3-phosphate dehydrogenase (NAD(P)+)